MWRCDKWSSVPVARKCCFCVPVRRGVIIFGYVNLVLSLLSFPLLVFLLAERATRGAAGARLPVAIALVVLDAALTVLLLVAAHKRLRALLLAYAWGAGALQLVSLALDVLLLREPAPPQPQDALYLLFLGLNVYLLYLVVSLWRRLPAPPRGVPYVAYRSPEPSVAPAAAL